MGRGRGAQHGDDRAEPGDETNGRSSSPSWTNLERLPPPPQLPADGKSLIAPRWTRGRGNDLAEPAADQPSAHRERHALGRIGRYDVLGRVHLGRYVSVYLARSPYPKSELVALKVSRSKSPKPDGEKTAASAGSWSDALRAVAHPNLCSLLEITHHESLKCIVHTWLEGVPLSRLLERLSTLDKIIPEHIAASVVSQLAAGIDHAEHMLATRGVPESAGPTTILPNDVMLCTDGRAVLLDLRWRSSADDGKPPMKQSVRILGDLLAILLTGYSRQPGESAPARRGAHVVPPELSEIVERTRPEHETRFSDCLALSTALQHFVGYESNQEERDVIAAFVDAQFPDRTGREPPIQTGAEVRRALRDAHTAEHVNMPSSVLPRLTDVTFAAPTARQVAREALWIAAAIVLAAGGYVLSTLL